MKKLFILLILSFLSAQGLAAGCPDGSDPVKSVSADGTYFVYNCSGGNEKASSSTAKNLKFELDTENGKLEDYSYITDPTGNFNKVHKFTTGSECGSKTRDIDWDNMVGEMESSDCGENSVRSQMVEQVWEDNRPGDIQPKYQWYTWDVYLPEDFPIQDSGKLLLGEFHNAECAHISFTSQGGEDKGVLHFETMKLWNGDCKATSRIPITQIQDMRGKWTNFHLEMKWENNETGLANLWLNGKQVLAYKGRTLTLQKENLNFMLFGLYQCCNDRDKVIKPAMAYFSTPKASMNPITPVVVTLDNKKTASSFKVKPELEASLVTVAKASNAFDGSYSFTLERFNPSEGSIDLGRGILEIKDGKISVSKKSRQLKTSSTSYYDTFEGQIDKKGNIASSFTVNALKGKGSPVPVNFSGRMNEFQIKGKFDDYFEMIFQIKPIMSIESVKKVGEAANNFDGSYALIIRTEPTDGNKNIGTAQFIIKDGKISIARKYRYLSTSAISSYDTFEGVIDKEGNINASIELNPIMHMVEPKSIKLSGTMESLQIQGIFDNIKSWDNNTKEYVLDENFYPYNVIIDFKKENY